MKYCPVCNCEQEVLLVQKRETYLVKGEPFTMTTISAKPMQNIALAMGFCNQKKSRLSASHMAFRKLHLLVWLERKIMPLLVTKMAVCRLKLPMIELC